MDDDFDFDTTVKPKSSTKMGRRAKAQQNASLDSAPQLDRVNTTHIGSNDPPVSASAMAEGDRARPGRRVGGWGEDSQEIEGAPLPSRGRRRGAELDTSTNTRFTKFDDDNDSDNDIPVIPDLEETIDSGPAEQIAVAPSVMVNKVASYKELDSDLQRSSQFAILDGDIDLKLLTNCLVSEQETKNNDRQWTWDLLFTEVSSELQTEWDEQNGENIPTETTATA